jgi:truncated hemoglobin YjbI
MADDVVSHAFSHGFHPEHSERLAAYWAEALGGPATFSAAYGDESSVVRIHSGNGPHEEMDRRAITCFDQALEDIGLAGADRLREVLHDYFTWATTTRCPATTGRQMMCRTVWRSRTGLGVDSPTALPSTTAEDDRRRHRQSTPARSERDSRRVPRCPRNPGSCGVTPEMLVAGPAQGSGDRPRTSARRSTRLECMTTSRSVRTAGVVDAAVVADLLDRFNREAIVQEVSSRAIKPSALSEYLAGL